MFSPINQKKINGQLLAEPDVKKTNQDFKRKWKPTFTMVSLEQATIQSDTNPPPFQKRQRQI